jgi:oligopeptidase B
VERHGERVQDDYHWLRRREDPRVRAYLEAENAYTEAVMRPTTGLQGVLYEEMLARIKQTDLSVPERMGGYYYYSRTEEGRQYPFHCRKQGSLDAPEEILLDENALAEGHDHFRLGVFDVSPDASLLAFSVDLDGSELYTLRFKDLRTGRLLPDEIPGTYYALEWAADSRTVFYNTVDASRRPYRLHRHRLGDDPAADVLVHEETDESFYLDLYKTKDQRWLVLELQSKVTSEVWFLPAADPTAPFRVVERRRAGVEYWLEHHGESFYILTNDQAVNFRLMRAPVHQPGREQWAEVIPHRPQVKLESIHAFRSHLVLLEREEGLRHLSVLSLPSLLPRRIDFPDAAYTVAPLRNREFDSVLLRFAYSSMVSPRSVFDYDMETGARELKKQEEVLGGYDPNRYVSERLFAEAPDGVLVPISLVHKKALPPDVSSPLLLYGYGAYGASNEPAFDSTRFSLIDRGFVYAMAHVRGGGELGRPWYEAGKLLRKRNTFTDFLACAEHLIATGYTSPDRLVIRGGSAGGLLVGAVLNMRPELFAAAVAKVPFVDVINTMLDETLPLTVTEWEEWGDPRRKEYYDCMRAYSPYDNVGAKPYPDLLVVSSLNDPRVAYWEPAKWVARLRACKTGEGRLLLKTHMDAGHAGPSGRYDRLRELAFELAFVLDSLARRGVRL